MEKSSLKFDSICVREIKENRTTRPHVLPIYSTSSFAFEDVDQGIRIFRGDEEGHVYSRFGNPTVDTVAQKIAQLESFGLDQAAAGILCSSGMSAILTLILATLKTGDKILTQANLYGGTTEQFMKILSPNGIEPIFTNLQDLSAVERLLKEEPRIRMIYGESPANPTVSCVDMDHISNLGKRYNAYTVIDNTFLTPYLQQPLKHGIDFVIHSTTKFLNGHGNSTAGAIVSMHRELIRGDIWRTMKLAGTNASPWEAWLVHNGLKTLAIRMDRHCQNALKLAQFLESHPAIGKVNYPGLPSHPNHKLALKQMRNFGAMLSFEILGGFKAATNFMSRLSLSTIAPTLGDVDTLVMHPASMSHVNLPAEVRMEQGIVDGLVRVSIGIENAEDILADFNQALE